MAITRAAGGSTSYVYDNNGNMKQGDGKTLTYNAFNLPLTVSRSGSTSTFSYGADLQRYKQVLSNSSGTETTHYIGKAAEVSIKGSTTTTRLFIDDIAIISKTQISGQNTASYAIRYTLRDRLGSVVSLTDEANQLSEHRSYDPFGKPRKGDYRQWNPATLTGVVGGTPFTSRGFTDHEHLDGAELIHMNGRVYDYNLGRFYSVDPIIQAPGNSQSMNPYSYIMNNPLAGTDPTGYTAECVEKEKCLDPPKRSNRSGRGFAQEVSYQRPNNGAEQKTEASATKSETPAIGAQAAVNKPDGQTELEADREWVKESGVGLISKMTPEEVVLFKEQAIKDRDGVVNFLTRLNGDDIEFKDKVAQFYGLSGASDRDFNELVGGLNKLGNDVVGLIDIAIHDTSRVYRLSSSSHGAYFAGRVYLAEAFWNSPQKAGTITHEFAHMAGTGHHESWDPVRASKRIPDLRGDVLYSMPGSRDRQINLNRNISNTYFFEFAVTKL